MSGNSKFRLDIMFDLNLNKCEIREVVIVNILVYSIGRIVVWYIGIVSYGDTWYINETYDNYLQMNGLIYLVLKFVQCCSRVEVQLRL
jgi:hypothetical protein